jgi:hypothetical protein
MRVLVGSGAGGLVGIAGLAVFVALAEQRSRQRRVAGPVGHLDGADDRIPALDGVTCLLAEPAVGDERIGVGRRQPDAGRVQVTGQPQYLACSRTAGGARAAGGDRDDRGAASPRCFGGLVNACVGNDDEVQRCARQRLGRAAHAGQAGREEVFLVVCGDDDADGV